MCKPVGGRFSRADRHAAAMALMLVLLCLPLMAAEDTSYLEDEDWPLSWRAIQAFYAGQYDRVRELAPVAIEQEPYNEELRLLYGVSRLWGGDVWGSTDIFRALLDTEFGDRARVRMANSLAWTGRIGEAVTEYELLLDTELDEEARKGLADAQRWWGRQDLALPNYRRLLEIDAEDEEYVNGALFSERRLRDRSEIGLRLQRDNSINRRDEGFVRHTWRNDELTRILSVELAGGEEWDEQLRLNQRELKLSVEDLDMDFAPKLELSWQAEPLGRVFGEVSIAITDAPTRLRLGHVNWSKLAFNVDAYEQDYSATLFGIIGKQPTAIGEFRGFANHYEVSDGNGVDDGSLRLTPWWRPLGPEVRGYLSLAWRYARFEVPDYWSPAAYLAGYLGIEGEWETPGWNIFLFGDLGTGINGASGATWTAGLNVKRWLGRDWSIALRAWAQSTLRTDNYKAHGGEVTLEHLW